MIESPVRMMDLDDSGGVARRRWLTVGGGSDEWRNLRSGFREGLV